MKFLLYLSFVGVINPTLAAQRDYKSPFKNKTNKIQSSQLSQNLKKEINSFKSKINKSKISINQDTTNQ